jgi:hypothetical protein
MNARGNPPASTGGTTMPIRVKNWDHFQHYKNRRPPWIKLYRELLDDPQWYDLSGDAAKALIMFWLIASENNGDLPASDVLAFRLRVDSNKLDSLISELKHYLDSDMLATCLQDAIPETERETEKSKRQRQTKREQHDAAVFASAIPEKYSVQFAEAWQSFCDHRADMGNAWLTERAIKLLLKTLEPLSEGEAIEALNKSVANGWKGVFPEKSKQTYGKPTQVLTTMPTDAEYAASENVERDANGIPIF